MVVLDEEPRQKSKSITTQNLKITEDDIQTGRYIRAIADPIVYGFIKEYEFHHRDRVVMSV